MSQELQVQRDKTEFVHRGPLTENQIGELSIVNCLPVNACGIMGAPPAIACSETMAGRWQAGELNANWSAL